MAVGSALHVSILEPARFEKEFYLGKEEYNATTKEGKAVREAELAEAAGRTYIRRKAGKDAVDADDVEGMTHSIWQHKAPKRFLEAPGQCEVSAVWKDPVTGLTCKGRFDKLINPGLLKVPIIFELKSSRHVNEWRFGKKVAELFYHVQARFYMWGHEQITGVLPAHQFLAIENKEPWAVKLWTLGDRDLQTGAMLFRRWLDQFAACQKSNQWPGYADRVDVLTMPDWANREDAA